MRTSIAAMAATCLIAYAAVQTPGLAGATSSPPPPPPSPAVADVFIVGGEVAPVTPWTVKVWSGMCTGVQVNDSWVLTARHCLLAANAGSVNPDAPDYAEGNYPAPSGDIGLIRLAKPVERGVYPKLDLAANAQATGSGTIMGYGNRANSVPSDGLYRAEVALTGASNDAFGGQAQHLTGLTGAANHGDSGGPLIVDGKVVAVCSTGDSADPGSDIHAGSNYALLAQAGDWIVSTAGL